MRFPASQRLYRLALLLYPGEFRRRYAAEMEHVFVASLLIHSRRHRLLGLPYVWLRTLWDTVARATAERALVIRRKLGFGAPGKPPRKHSSGFESLLQDLRHGGRALLRSPRFTVVAVFTLALGIGVSAAVFSIVNATMLRPGPVEEPDRVVEIWGSRPETDRVGLISYPDYADYREQARSFSALVARGSTVRPLVRGDGDWEQIWATGTSHDFFAALGVQPALGRAFVAEDDEPGAEAVVVISHRLWQRQFGGKPEAIGQALDWNRQRLTVIGVAPPGFQGFYPGIGIDAWATLGAARRELPTGMVDSRRQGLVWMIGWLAPGVGQKQAQSELSAIAQRLEEAYPESNGGRGARISPGIEGERMRTIYAYCMAAVGLVLLAACANVASMWMARASVRRKETAVRMALGCSRWRLVRYLFTESLLVGLPAGGLGLLLGYWSAGPLILWVGSTGYMGGGQDVDVSPDIRVIGFVLAASLLAATIFGLLPALAASRLELGPALKGTSRRGGRRALAKNTLVAAQVAICVVLLSGAALLSRSLGHLQSIDTGVETDRVLEATLRFDVGAADDAEAAILMRQILERLEANPRVGAASVTMGGPIRGGGAIGVGVLPDGREPAVDAETLTAFGALSTPGFFPVMGIPIVQGRGFAPEDEQNGADVAIVSETLARQLWPGENPLGRRLTTRGGRFYPFMTGNAEVVGVARDVISDPYLGAPSPSVYLPLHWAPLTAWPVTLFVRPTIEPAALGAELRAEVAAIDEDIPVLNVQSYAEATSWIFRDQRLSLGLSATFGVLTALLAAVGVGGVVAHVTARRVPEIGVRMTLGARGNDVVVMVVTQGMKPITIGLAIGLAAALASARLIAGLIYGVSTTDPLSFAAVAVLLAAVALLACYLPARRAAVVDPVTALRAE